MSTTHFTGRVDSAAGFAINGTNLPTAAETNVLSGVTPGTATASKALVLNSSKGIATITSATVTTLTSTTGAITTVNSTTTNATTVNAGADASAGTVNSFPSTTASGKLILAAVNSSGAFNTTISNASMGQSTVVSIPDPGAATAKFVLDTAANAHVTVTDLLRGATPVHIADAGSSTITAAAGAANTSTVTIQLKDGAGNNLSRSMYFEVYASSASDGLTLAAAASTGFSVASGGLSLANGTAVTTMISCMSSATGGCVLSLLDTNKRTSFLVLVLPDGNKISAQLSAGSYG